MIKRSITINGHSTSYSLEKEFHVELEAIARDRAMSVAKLVTDTDHYREPGTNLSSALRLLVLRSLKSRLASRTS